MKAWLTRTIVLKRGRMYDREAVDPDVPLTREQVLGEAIYRTLLKEIRARPEVPAYAAFLEWLDNPQTGEPQ
jgi:hypothetical protein